LPALAGDWFVDAYNNPLSAPQDGVPQRETHLFDRTTITARPQKRH
jgi:hypothetical protein